MLDLVAAGASNAAVADALVVSRGTVKKHLDNIYGKLGVRSRTAAAERARVPPGTGAHAAPGTDVATSMARLGRGGSAAAWMPSAQPAHGARPARRPASPRPGLPRVVRLDDGPKAGPI